MPSPSQIRMSNRLRTANDIRNEKLDRDLLRRALRFARPYRTRIVFSFLGILGAAGVGVLPPLVFRQLIDHAIPQRNFEQVNLLFLAAVVLALATTGLNVINRWLSATVGEGLIYDLRSALYDHVQRMPLSFFTRTQTGSLLSRLNNDVVGAQNTVTTATTVASDLFTLATTFVAMFILSWKVTLLALLVVPFFILLDRFVGRRLIGLFRRRMEANADMTATMQERFNVSGALLVKLFGDTRRESKTFAGRAGDVRDAGIRQALWSRIYYGALALTASLGTALVYWLGARAVIDGALTVGTLTALAAYVARLYDPLTSIASARVDLLTALVSFERCFEVLDTKPSITQADNARALPTPEGRIELDHVWFRYPATSETTIASLEVVNAGSEEGDEPSDWILRDVSLSIAAGQTVALVGHTGAGKTTLSSLVPRLYDVTEGAVRIDGQDVRELTLDSIKDSVGVVSQETHLFHESIAENLRYAKPDATDEELQIACRRARIDHLIESLPDTYRTTVGERGYRLSGGEKQRLAIARVLLKQPAIVVLDEATAHLDSETEALVQQALAEALHGRTALVIAHRLSTIRNADLIVVLDNGTVAETGTHSELLERNGPYADLYRTQYA